MVIMLMFLDVVVLKMPHTVVIVGRVIFVYETGVVNVVVMVLLMVHVTVMVMYLMNVVTVVVMVLKMVRLSVMVMYLMNVGTVVVLE